MILDHILQCYKWWFPHVLPCVHQCAKRKPAETIFHETAHHWDWPSPSSWQRWPAAPWAALPIWHRTLWVRPVGPWAIRVHNWGAAPEAKRPHWERPGRTEHTKMPPGPNPWLKVEGQAVRPPWLSLWAKAHDKGQELQMRTWRQKGLAVKKGAAASVLLAPTSASGADLQGAPWQRPKPLGWVAGGWQPRHVCWKRRTGVRRPEQPGRSPPQGFQPTLPCRWWKCLPSAPKVGPPRIAKLLALASATLAPRLQGLECNPYHPCVPPGPWPRKLQPQGQHCSAHLAGPAAGPGSWQVTGVAQHLALPAPVQGRHLMRTAAALASGSGERNYSTWQRYGGHSCAIDICLVANSAHPKQNLNCDNLPTKGTPIKQQGNGVIWVWSRNIRVKLHFLGCTALNEPFLQTFV